MALFQLMLVGKDGLTRSSGNLSKNLKHLKRRLSKQRKGFIEELRPAPEGKQIVVCRGFSRDMQEALQTCGMEVV